MKRWILYLLILAVVLIVPQRGMDVGKLLPVELVSIRTEWGDIVVETDTEDSGRGRTLKAAFENLEKTTTGVIYLDTADYLLLTPEAMEIMGEIEPYLKKKTQVCICEKKVDLKGAAAYLAVHNPEVTLDAVMAGMKAPKLTKENGNYMLKRT